MSVAIRFFKFTFGPTSYLLSVISLGVVSAFDLCFCINMTFILTYAQFSLRPGIQPKLEALRTLYPDKKIIVGRDKLDVVKGVLQKVSLIFSHPLLRSKLSFEMPAPRIRETPAGLPRVAAQSCAYPGLCPVRFHGEKKLTDPCVFAGDITRPNRLPEARTSSFGTRRAYQWRVWELGFHTRASLVRVQSLSHSTYLISPSSQPPNT